MNADITLTFDALLHTPTAQTASASFDDTLQIARLSHGDKKLKVGKKQMKMEIIFVSSNYILSWERLNGIHRDIHSRDSGHDDDGDTSQIVQRCSPNFYGCMVTSSQKFFDKKHLK